ncbi:alpha/beta hydrolase family protein [Subtercola sp. YIM 133946]|uniref:alpha/beta hydrolase family protein n=1 Tax=Subtercola sp. YIM 133946 TaxID=3118909 RepID=UPI002F936036
MTSIDFGIASALGDIPATLVTPDTSDLSGARAPGARAAGARAAGAQAVGERLDVPTDPREADGRPGVPAVLLLHGTASSRSEVGGMFVRLAEALAARGVASLRIDFAGSGDSTRPQTGFTVASQLADAQAAFDWLAAEGRIDAGRIGVLGFSQGGMIATLLAGREPQVAALTLWSSGIVAGGAFGVFAPYFEGLEAVDEATVDLGFTTFTFTREWWLQAQSMPLVGAIGRYGHPLFVVAGSDDDTIAPDASLELLRHAASADVEFRMIANADHIFRALDAGSPLADTVIELTASWFAHRLGA